MPQASFVHSAGSVTFSRGPLRPDLSLGLQQPQRQTAGGIRFGYAYTVADNIIKLSLRLTDTEQTTLLAFFNTIVNGMAEPFTYNDTTGVATNVRFNTPLIDGLTDNAYNSNGCIVELRREP